MMSTSSNEERTMLKQEVSELRAALATVTEALVLFQEFIESEICEMTYFRESGAYGKLGSLLNSLRMTRSSQLRPKSMPKLTPISTQNQRLDNVEITNLASKRILGETALEKSNLGKTSMVADFMDDSQRKQKAIKINHVFSISQPGLRKLEKPKSDVPVLKIGDKEKFPNQRTSNDKPAIAEDGLEIRSRLASNPELSVSDMHSSDLNGSLNLKQSTSANFNLGGKSLAKPESNIQAVRKKPSNGPVKCTICLRTYSSRGVMSRHLKEAHKPEPQFLCFYCPSKFRTGPIRLQHMNLHHRAEMQSVTCPYCHRKAANSTGKRNHMMLCAKRHLHNGNASSMSITLNSGNGSTAKNQRP